MYYSDMYHSDIWIVIKKMAVGNTTGEISTYNGVVKEKKKEGNGKLITDKKRYSVFSSLLFFNSFPSL